MGVRGRHLTRPPPTTMTDRAAFGSLPPFREWERERGEEERKRERERERERERGRGEEPDEPATDDDDRPSSLQPLVLQLPETGPGTSSKKQFRF